MDPRLIYLARHGQIQLEDDQRRYIGQIDLPLSAEGRRQALQLKRGLAHAELGAIACSDLTRTRQTAELIAEGSGVPVRLCPELREVAMGEWEGATFRDIATRFPEAYRARGQDLAGFRVPGGESFVQCGERVVRAFEALLGSTRGPLLIVGHAGPNRLLLCHVLGLPVASLFRISQDYGCLNVIQCGTSGYQVKLVNGRGRHARG
jgi:alpha-ribazole phosphatase